MSALYAYVTTTERTIVSVSVGNSNFPCVFAKRESAELMLPMVALLSTATGQPIQLVKYVDQEVLIADVTRATSTSSQGA